MTKTCPLLQVTWVTSQKGHSPSLQKWDPAPLWAGNQRQEAWGHDGVGTPRVFFGWRLHNTQSSTGLWGRAPY